MKLAAVECHLYELPLIDPLRIADRILTTRAGWLVRVLTEDGREGWGDIAPLPGFSREAPAQAWRELQAVLAKLTAALLADADPIADVEARIGNVCSSVRFGLECAVWEAAERAPSSWRLWPGGAATLALSALLAGSPERVLARARDIAPTGYRAVKVKVGRGKPSSDGELVRQVREILGPDVALRVDANRAWSLAEAAAFAECARAASPSYVEEPLREGRELERFHEATGLALGLDETVAERDDAGLDLPGVRAVVVKPSVSGGVQRLRNLAMLCGRRGVDVVVSAAFESGVGLRALARIAAGAGTQAAGLDTYRWLAADVLSPRLDIHGPVVDVASLAAAQIDARRLRRLL